MDRAGAVAASIAFHEEITTETSGFPSRSLHSQSHFPFGRRKVTPQCLVELAEQPVELNVVEHCICVRVDDAQHLTPRRGESAGKCEEGIRRIIREGCSTIVELILDVKRDSHFSSVRQTGVHCHHASVLFNDHGIHVGGQTTLVFPRVIAIVDDFHTTARPRTAISSPSSSFRATAEYHRGWYFPWSLRPADHKSRQAMP